jgi:CDP-diacylglycerol--glycerol-3-phosphate 3-phosphatidyltransferase
MLSNSKVRSVTSLVATPFAKVFIKLGISPDIITLLGTLGVCFAAIRYLSQGEFLIGSILFTFFVVFDALDGTIARLIKRSSKWGAFFDSVLDRIADGVVIGSITIYYFNQNKIDYVIISLVALVASEIVSYTKARAEGLGLNCDTGFAERPERVIVLISGTFLAGIGLTDAIDVAIWILAIMSIVTVGQRMKFVFNQAK